uniref:Uncharacterized protein AlNc14C264G9860 n=1 Tax=Albugo laibachii Nc14 TaxID=890382 RepID=F0WU37_9STRA|nr:conserved hypothetical protein [Albugo laibachii Nc14]|eukprot:CCA24882.1 conserved hypothetical protein [Albugo laibachii Nc14]
MDLMTLQQSTTTCFTFFVPYPLTRRALLIVPNLILDRTTEDGAFAIIASTLSIFGVNLQKLSHNKEELRSKPRPYHLRPLWWLGMICVVGASLGDFLALGFAPQTLVASLGGGATILGNCLMSRFWLKQNLYITDVIGVTMVTLGVIILAAASAEEGHFTMEQIYQLMQAAPFLLYCLLTTSFVMTIYMRARRSLAPALRAFSTKNQSQSQNQIYGQRAEHVVSSPDAIPAENCGEMDENQGNDARTRIQIVVNSFTGAKKRRSLSSPFPSPVHPISFGTSAMSNGLARNDGLRTDVIHCDTRNETLDSTESQVRKQILVIDPKLPLYWAAISGTIGAQSVLLAKCVAEMIFCTLKGDNQFVYLGTYMLIGGMVSTLITQTHTLNLATMTGDTMSSYPVFQAFWITMSNISGVVFFQQSHNFNSTQWTMFPSALLLVISGIYLISKHEKFGNRIKYSVAMPISLSSPRQHDIVAQSFVFRVMNPQRTYDGDEGETESAFQNDYPKKQSKREYSPGKQSSPQRLQIRVASPVS